MLALRNERGWTREKVADRAGMTASTYGRIEKGGPTITQKFLDIAEAFGVPVEAVLVPEGAQTPQVVFVNADQIDTVVRAMKQPKPRSRTELMEDINRSVAEEEKRDDPERTKKEDKKRPPHTSVRKMIQKIPKRRSGNE